MAGSTKSTSQFSTVIATVRGFVKEWSEEGEEKWQARLVHITPSYAQGII